MNSARAELLKKNLKVDGKVVSAVEELQKKLPQPQTAKRGSDYRIAPPLGGHSLTVVRR